MVFIRAQHKHLDHLLEEIVNLVLPVAKVTAIHKVVVLLPPSARRRVEFEVPEEVVGFLEVRSTGKDLMDKIFNANDSVFA
jgi:hypothetical protein